MEGHSRINLPTGVGDSYEVYVNGVRQEPGRDFDRLGDELLQKIWGRRESHRDRTVDVFVRRLREKLDRRTTRHTFIQTRYGVGYRLEPVTKE